MEIKDGESLRSILSDLFPNFVIESTPPPSNQRAVFFGYFAPNCSDTMQDDWSAWGKVVLKVSAGLSATNIAYLQREAYALNAIEADSFPKLHFENLFVENPITETLLDPKLYITIEERIDAIPLKDLTSRYNNERDLVLLLQKIVSALKNLWLHKNQYVHRDLKPEHILVRPNGSIAIIDLGIARESGESGLTMTHQPYGPCTPKYASPEQVRNDKMNSNRPVNPS